jgi:phosphopantothenoylcysteine decarboxylase/phosphopantothenate--cysteine ligase
MYRHPAIAGHMERLAEWGIDLVEPRIEEGKAKLATPESIVLHVERSLMGKPLDGKRVVVTSGACAEAVDDVRILTTRSTGRMGKEMALQAYRLGADVTVIHNGDLPCVRNVQSRSAAEMREAVHRVFRDGGGDIYVSAAAISDFSPKRVKGKIRSGAPVTLDLEPLPKLLHEVRESYHPVTIAFKMGRDEEGAAKALRDRGVEIVVVNTPDAMGAPGAEVTILSRDGMRSVKGSKEEVAAAIWTALL